MTRRVAMLLKGCCGRCAVCVCVASRSLSYVLELPGQSPRGEPNRILTCGVATSQGFANGLTDAACVALLRNLAGQK